MNKAIWLFAGILMSTGSIHAQDVPRVEISSGYFFLRLGVVPGVNQQGASGSVAVNLNRWFGVAGDFGGYSSPIFSHCLLFCPPSSKTSTFLFGPRFSHRGGDRITTFGQVLFGGAHLTSGLTPFAMSAGGGVDLRLSEHVAIRVVQIDYIA